MLTITDDPALQRAMHDTHVGRLLALRRSQLGDGWPEAAIFLVVEASDTLADAEAAVGFLLTLEGEPTCDWATRHDGVTELCFVLSDDGPSTVLLVPHRRGVDASLLGLVRSMTEVACVTGDVD